MCYVIHMISTLPFTRKNEKENYTGHSFLTSHSILSNTMFIHWTIQSVSTDYHLCHLDHTFENIILLLSKLMNKHKYSFIFEIMHFLLPEAFPKIIHVCCMYVILGVFSGNEAILKILTLHYACHLRNCNSAF